MSQRCPQKLESHRIAIFVTFYETQTSFFVITDLHKCIKYATRCRRHGLIKTQRVQLVSELFRQTFKNTKPTKKHYWMNGSISEIMTEMTK